MSKREQSTKSTKSVKSKKTLQAASRRSAAASRRSAAAKVARPSTPKATAASAKKSTTASAGQSAPKSAKVKPAAGKAAATGKAAAGKAATGKAATGKAATGKAAPNKISQQDSFAAYLKSVPAAARPTLQSLRRTIEAVVPEATATLSYGIAAFRLQGRLLLGIGATAQHCAIYLMSARTVRSCAELLADFDSSVGTVRFPHRSPPAPEIVRTLVETRLAEQNQSSLKKTKKSTEE